MIAMDVLIRCVLNEINFLHGSIIQTEQVFALAHDLAINSRNDIQIPEYRVNIIDRIFSLEIKPELNYEPLEKKDIEEMKLYYIDNTSESEDTLYSILHYFGSLYHSSKELNCKFIAA
jgi:hypothetical protein